LQCRADFLVAFGLALSASWGSAAGRNPLSKAPILVPPQLDLFISHKVLFAPNAVRSAVRSDNSVPLESAAVERLRRWQGLLASDVSRVRLNEESYKAEFLKDVFGMLLGFQDVGGSDIYNMRREVSGPEDNRTADAVLGVLGAVEVEQVRAVVEVKAPGINLDARQSSRGDRLSPVDQCFLYASQFEDVRWVVVTNFDEIRLYSTRRGKTAYESFALLRLDGEELHRFTFLLSRDNLVGDGRSASRTQLLAEETWREQAQVSRRFYGEYQEARLTLFEELRRQNPSVPPRDVLSATQTFLDRLLFVLFCVDRGLLPHNLIDQLRRLADTESFAYRADTLWRALLSLFESVNHGNPPAKIPGYNGGLFSPGPIDGMVLLDTVRSPGFILTRLLKWDDLDFEAQLDVEVLGHIFENSISDLARLERELLAEPDTLRLEWRNREGIFYTPDWVTEYIVQHTVERYLDENATLGADLVVLDPACGSGAFLTQLVRTFRRRLDQVAPAEAARVRAAQAAASSAIDLFNDPAVVEPLALYSAVARSIFGVDKSRDSIEISKLSLWLKIVVKGHPLPRLDDNIKCGNSLVSDKEFAEDAFAWEQELPRVAAGAHVIVGNPPWGADASPYERGLRGLQLAVGQYDTAFLFVERALSLLRHGGILGFVLPDSLLINEDQVLVRRLLAEQNSLLEVIKLGEGVFPGVFRGSVIVIVKKEAPSPDHSFRGLVVRKSDRRDIDDVASVVDLDVLMAQRGTTIPNARVVAQVDCALDINVGEDDRVLMRKIERRRFPWGLLMARGRGVELNSEGHVVQCPACFKWDPPPLLRKGIYSPKVCSHCEHEYRIEDALSRAALIAAGDAVGGVGSPFIDGTDIGRYSILRVRRIDRSKDGIAYKEPTLYASPKIVFRQTGVGTTATIDYDLDAYVPQSVYVLRLRPEATAEGQHYRLEYILGVLNSRLLLYHFLRSTGQVEWQSFPRWTLGRVFKIPVRAIDWTDAREVELHDRIAEEVELLIRSGGQPNSKHDLQVERLVMDLYGVSPTEKEHVWRTLKEVKGVRTVTDLIPS